MFFSNLVNCSKLYNMRKMSNFLISICSCTDSEISSNMTTKTYHITTLASRECLFFGFCSPWFLPKSSSSEQLTVSFSPVGGKILLGNHNRQFLIWKKNISVCSTCVVLTLTLPNFGHESTRSTRDSSRRWTSSRWCRSWVKYEVRSPKFIWAVQLYSLAEETHSPSTPPPHLG